MRNLARLCRAQVDAGAALLEDETMKKKTGRSWLVSIGLASLISMAAGIPAAHALDKVKAVIPQNSVFVLNWQGGKDAGIFTKHGIDLEVDVRPFAGYLAGIPSKEPKATTYSGIDAIATMNEGLNLAVIGGGLTVFQDVFVRKDSPFKTISDLRGKKFGVWSSGAGAYKATRVAILESDGFDIAKDATLVQLAPPALFKLLERGEIDAMLNISTFTINAFAQPDKYRPIFSANEYWKKKTGYPIVWSAPIGAWKDWVEGNPTRAKNFAAGTEESFRWLRDPANCDAAVKKYGTLAGVTTPEAIATYKKLLGEKRIFLAHWDQKVVDAEWQFLELVKKHGVLKDVPDKKQHALVLGN
jgi:ABC-type nitrate/sulfonate/bicarbonate transport system substrate-binding protein